MFVSSGRFGSSLKNVLDHATSLLFLILNMKRPSAAASSSSGASQNDPCSASGVGAYRPFKISLPASGTIDLYAEENDEGKQKLEKLSWIVANKQKLAEWMDNNGGREPLQKKTSSKEETAMAIFVVKVKNKHANNSLAPNLVQEFENISWWSWTPKKLTWQQS